MRFFKKKKIINRQDGEPYLIRWNLFECRFFSIKIHKILRSDPDCLHDHPWAFVSFILWGGYVEHTIKYKSSQNQITLLRETKSKIIHPFSILYRPAKWAHRLEIHQPAITLVITTKKIRQWGFFTPLRWVHWTKYDGG